MEGHGRRSRAARPRGRRGDDADQSAAPGDLDRDRRGIPPEQFAELALLVEPLPDARRLTFPTTQYYSDGTVVTWDQPSRTAARARASGADARPVAADEAFVARSELRPAVSAAPARPTGVSHRRRRVARWLSVAALVLALAALAVSLRRRPAVRSTDRSGDG